MTGRQNSRQLEPSTALPDLAARPYDRLPAAGTYTLFYPPRKDVIGEIPRAHGILIR